MTNGNRPLGPYDPTEEEIAAARTSLDAFDDREFAATYVIGWIESELAGTGKRGNTAEETVRRSRAMIAAYRAQREAAES